MPSEPATLFLCGDVMLGRGVDSLLPHPGDPTLREPSIRDARVYLRLAERRNGVIPRPAGFDWPWGDALPALAELAPDARVINLETAITSGDDFAPGKSVHYRMNPANLPCLRAIRPDVCALANNHVLDFGRRGLCDTLNELAGAGIATAGAGRDLASAQAPAVVPLGGGRRLLVAALGSPSSGIPGQWAASRTRPGVALLPDLSARTAAAVSGRLAELRRPGDVVVVSVHWGGNWGYGVDVAQRRFAHRLIDGGVHVVHGHSSHHPRPVERHGDGLVLYGCGDAVDDYEGITGYERFRDDLRPLYLATVTPDGGAAELRVLVLRSRQLRLHRAPARDVEWLCDLLSGISAPFGARFEQRPDGLLHLRPR